MRKFYNAILWKVQLLEVGPYGYIGKGLKFRKRLKFEHRKGKYFLFYNQESCVYFLQDDNVMIKVKKKQKKKTSARLDLLLMSRF